MKKNKILKLVIFTSIFLIFSGSVFALEVDYIPIMDEPAPTDETSLPDYVRYVYVFVLFISGSIAMAVITINGVKYIISSGDPVKIGEARKWLASAFGGIVILASASIVLYTIHPDLIILKEPKIEEVKPKLTFSPLPTPPMFSVANPDVLERIKYLAQTTMEIPDNIYSVAKPMIDYNDPRVFDVYCSAKEPLECPENKWYSFYYHMDEIENGVTEGSEIEVGEIIGKIGEKGTDEGPHLHFGVGFLNPSGSGPYQDITTIPISYDITPPGGYVGEIPDDVLPKSITEKQTLDLIYIWETMTIPVSVGQCAWYENKNSPLLKDYAYYSKKWRCKSENLTQSADVKNMFGYKYSGRTMNHLYSEPPSSSEVKTTVYKVYPNIGGIILEHECISELVPEIKIKDIYPSDDSTDIPANSYLEITFSHPVAYQQTIKYVTIKNATTGEIFEQIDLRDRQRVYGWDTENITIGPNNFMEDTNYYILIDEGAFISGDIMEPPKPFKGIEDPTEWNFETSSSGSNPWPTCIPTPPFGPCQGTTTDTSTGGTNLPPGPTCAPPPGLCQPSPVTIYNTPCPCQDQPFEPPPEETDWECLASIYSTATNASDVSGYVGYPLIDRQMDMVNKIDVVNYYINRLKAEKEDLNRDIFDFINPTLEWFSEEIRHKLQQLGQNPENKETIAKQLAFLEERMSWAEEEKVKKEDIVKEIEELIEKLEEVKSSSYFFSNYADICIDNLKYSHSNWCVKSGRSCVPNRDYLDSFLSCPYLEAEEEIKKLEEIRNPIKALCNKIIYSILTVQKEKTPTIKFE